MRRYHRQKPLSIVPDLFIEAHFDLMAATGRRFANEVSYVEPERGPTTEMVSQFVAVPPNCCLRRRSLEVQQNAFALGRLERLDFFVIPTDAVEIDALMRLKAAGNLHSFPLIGRCSIALEHPIAIQGDCSSGRIITISKNRGNLDRREQKQDNSVPAMALAHENLSLLLFSFRRRSRLTGKKQLRDRVIENAVIFAHPRQRRSLSS